VCRAMVVAVVSLLLDVGCEKETAKTEAKAEAKVDSKEPGDEPQPEEKVPSFAEPKMEPPRGPEGTITLPDPWLYVQTCAEPLACPELLQPAGDKHCRELQIGG